MKTRHLLAAASALVLAGWFPGQTAAQDCVSAFDMEHCPLGSATLDVTPDGQGLEVTGLGPDGESGVSSHFEPTTFWSARTLFIGDSSEAPSVHLASISGGAATSHLSLESDGEAYYLSASFTGQAQDSTYSMLVYLDGVLQGGVGGVSSNLGSVAGKSQAAPSGSAFSKAHQSLCSDCQPDLTAAIAALDARMVAWLAWIDSFRWGFGIRNDGGCSWSTSLPAAASVTLPNGSEFVGDEIRLVEEVQGSGHYPYLGFESIEGRTSAEGLRIVDESTGGLE